MKNKDIGIVLISILISSALGFGASWFILNPRIEDLQDQIISHREQTLVILDNINSNLESINSTLEAINSTFYKLETDQAQIHFDLSELQSSLEAIESRDWHVAYSIYAEDDVTSDKFVVNGESIRIRWFSKGESFLSMINIDILFVNGTKLSMRGSSGLYSSYACDMAIEPGEYYIEVTTYDIEDYSIYIWDYY